MFKEEKDSNFESICMVTMFFFIFLTFLLWCELSMFFSKTQDLFYLLQVSMSYWTTQSFCKNCKAREPNLWLYTCITFCQKFCLLVKTSFEKAVSAQIRFVSTLIRWRRFVRTPERINNMKKKTLSSLENKEN